MYGIYWLLSWLPFGVTVFLLYLMTIGVIFVLRDQQEGLFYNTSYSAMIGDGALLTVVVMAIGILKTGGAPPTWQSTFVQPVIAFVSIMIGFIWYMRDLPKYSADRYHHLVIAPLLLFLLFTLVPVVFKNGTTGDIAAMLFLLVLWFVLVVFDIGTNRMNQREYLANQGIELKK